MGGADDCAGIGCCHCVLEATGGGENEKGGSGVGADNKPGEQNHETFNEKAKAIASAELELFFAYYKTA